MAFPPRRPTSETSLANVQLLPPPVAPKIPQWRPNNFSGGSAISASSMPEILPRDTAMGDLPSCTSTPPKSAAWIERDSAGPFASNTPSPTLGDTSTPLTTVWVVLRMVARS